MRWTFVIAVILFGFTADVEACHRGGGRHGLRARWRERRQSRRHEEGGCQQQAVTWTTGCPDTAPPGWGSTGTHPPPVAMPPSGAREKIPAPPGEQP